MYHTNTYSQKTQSTVLTALSIFVLITVVSVYSVGAQLDFGNAVRVVDEEGQDGTIELYGYNDLPIPVYVSFEATRIQNYHPSFVLPYTVVIPPQTTHHSLLSFSIIDSFQSSSIRYTYSLSASDPTRPVRHDDTYRYLFPYAHGEKLEVGQTHNGRYSHSNDTNRYAIDFNTDIGTPIHAARGGLVVSVKEDSNRGGASANYIKDANIIVVMHDDGTLGYYVHLQRNGSLVEVGERIKTGQHIGSSGNTGQSSGPHLHFDVHLPGANSSSKSIPVTFISANGEVVSKPETGFYYYSVHSNGRPFEAVLGRYITVNSFDGYINPTDPSDKVGYRTESIDNTILAFCSNGTEDDADVQIDFNIRGLISELDYPIETIIPAESEVFCGLFRLQQNATRWGITPDIQRHISIDSFDGYIKSTEPSNEIDFRTEKIDKTILAFCFNGTENNANVQIDFKISGLISELDYPIDTIIPAESEIFCGLFRFRPNATRSVITPEWVITTP